ncbi:MAG TPA: peptidoglycan editing factor PgeF [Steroidobacteraceae bacterium]|nr:peptidoglycan editing factor PgeF [Steroidobacteraceae bacterium]
MNGESPTWIGPEWPAPARVRVLSTLRTGGVSTGRYASLNLALHVGDDPTAVAENRRRLRMAARLPAEPLWLEQVHGARVVANVAPRAPGDAPPQADACMATEPGRVCAVMTADCLPVVFSDRAGTCVAVAHAGWRGLAGGVLEATVAALKTPPTELLAWLGPAIGPAAFEVGAEVREAFLGRCEACAAAFTPNAAGRYQADLYALTRTALSALDVTAVFGGGWCTHRQAEAFFSFRRDRDTGRMATLAWLDGMLGPHANPTA